MGYSNIAGDLNVYGTTTMSSLVMNGLLIASNGSAISNIQASNVVGTVGTAQSVTATAQGNITSVGTLTGLTVSGLLIASNGSAISNINSANIVQPFANLVVSNALTTTNIFAAGFTSNAANTIFNYDTLTIPFINSTTLNVASTANVLVQTIQGSSGLPSLTVTGNIYASNALSTTNIFASGNVVIGPTVTAIQGNLHVEQSTVFIGNSAAVGSTVNTTSVNQGTLVFDNTATASIIPNKIVLFNNTAAVNQYCGIGVGASTPSAPSITYYAKGLHIFYTNPGTEVMRITAAQTVGIGTQTVTAKLHVVGNIYASNALQTTNVVASGNITASGQISAVGNTVSASYGVCPPLTARQGVAASTNWNPSGGTQGNFFLSSGVVNMQAGSNTMAVSPTTITFPISYTNNPIVLITPYATTATTNPWVSAVTTTNFQVTWTNFGTFEWVSLGI